MTKVKKAVAKKATKLKKSASKEKVTESLSSIAQNNSRIAGEQPEEEETEDRGEKRARGRGKRWIFVTNYINMDIAMEDFTKDKLQENEKARGKTMYFVIIYYLSFFVYDFKSISLLQILAFNNMLALYKYIRNQTGRNYNGKTPGSTTAQYFNCNRISCGCGKGWRLVGR